MGKTIIASFGASRVAKTNPIHQFDYGRVLKFVGIDLPPSYEVHFANEKNGRSKTQIGGPDGVLVPDEYAETGETVWSWVFLHEDQDDGETEYTAEIPVIRRARPTDEPPTPHQQSVIDQAIAALDAAVASTEADASRAEEAAQQAEDIAQSLPEVIEAAIAGKADKSYVDTKLAEKMNANQGASNKGKLMGVGAGGNVEYINVDNSPTEDSTALVRSGGVYEIIADLTQILTDGLAQKLDANQGAANAGKLMGVDSDGEVKYVPIETELVDSGNPVSSGAVKTEVERISTVMDAVVVEEEASGPIATIGGGIEGMPVKTMVVDIYPIQSGSGDPSPGNVRPISGWTGLTVFQRGQNLLKLKDGSYTVKSVAVTISDGQITLSGTARGSGGRTIRLSEPFTLPPGTYFLSRISTPIANLTRASNNTAVPVAGSVVTLTEATEVFFGLNFHEGTEYDMTLSPYLSVGLSDPGYAPYVGEELSVSCEAEAGTVYAGTLDVLTGTLRARPYYAAYAGEALVGPWLSSMDVYAEGATPTTGAQVVDLGGQQTTYQLTPQEVKTLLGRNNFWVDAGVVSVAATETSQGYTDIKISNAKYDLMCLIAEQSGAFAGKSYSVGDFLIVGETLFRVTAEIAKEETIQEGVNVEATTVAEQLKALWDAL